MAPKFGKNLRLLLAVSLLAFGLPIVAYSEDSPTSPSTDKGVQAKVPCTYEFTKQGLKPDEEQPDPAISATPDSKTSTSGG